MITVAELIQILSEQDPTLWVEVNTFNPATQEYEYPDVQEFLGENPTYGYVCLVAR